MCSRAVAQTVDSILSDYEHDTATYAKVGETMNADMLKGLSKSENKDATLKMLITYVRDLPTGQGTACIVPGSLGGKAIPPIPKHFSVTWSVCLSSATFGHPA